MATHVTLLRGWRETRHELDEPVNRRRRRTRANNRRGIGCWRRVSGEEFASRKSLAIVQARDYLSISPLSLAAEDVQIAADVPSMRLLCASCALSAAARRCGRLPRFRTTEGRPKAVGSGERQLPFARRAVRSCSPVRVLPPSRAKTPAPHWSSPASLNHPPAARRNRRAAFMKQGPHRP